MTNHLETDTLRINLLNKIARETHSVDFEKKLQYASQADSLSNILNFKKGKSESLQLIGSYYFNRQEPLKALAAYQQALAISQNIGDKIGISYSYNYIGNINLMQGYYVQAQKYYQKALHVFEETDDRIGISGIYNNLGNIYYMQGDYPRTLEYFQKALKVFKELKNKAGISGIYNNMGVIYDEQGDYSKALKYYQKALDIRKDIDNRYGISDTYTNIGNIYYVRKEYPKALEYFQKSLEINKELNYNTGISISYLNMGIIFLAQEHYAKSLNSFQKSIKIAIEINSQDLVTNNNIEFCNVYYKLKNYKSAILYGEKGYNTAVEAAERDNIKKAAEILAKCYAATGNFNKAYQYQIEFKTQSDSLFNESNIEKITNLENQYKFEKEKEIIVAAQAKKNELKETELQHQKVIRNSLIAGFALTILFVLFIFRILAQKHKANLLLAKRYNEVKMLNKTKDNILSVISHDLRGPVGSLKSFVDLLLDNVNDYSKVEITESFGILSKQSGSVYTILNNLLLWANSQRKNINYQPEKQLIMNAVADNIALLEAIANLKEITLQNNVQAKLEATFDNNLISTVVRNLINNAIKFTPHGGVVSINATENEKYHTIVVTDTGIGISKERANTIFEKTSYETTYGTNDEKGSGLGLKLCYEFVEIHNGKIWIESELEKGSKFYFSIPK